jgi:hypothetical protein
VPDLAGRYAIVIGISDYRYDNISKLRYASGEAADIAEVLESYGYSVTTLRDGDATREGILRAISRSRSVLKESDQLLVYFAGRLLEDQWSSEAYLATHDTEPAFLEVNALRISQLVDYLSDVPAANTLVVLDQSYSSSRVERRPLDIQGAIEKSYYGGRVSGLTLVTSIRGDGAPFSERSTLAEAFHDALSSGFADGNQDGALTIGELLDFTLLEADRRARAGNHVEPVVAWTTSRVNDWTVVNLTPDVTDKIDEVEFVAKQRDLYAELLSQFANANAISVRTRLFTQALLDRWVASVKDDVPMNPDDQVALREVNAILGSAVSGREKARTLESLLIARQESFTPK